MSANTATVSHPTAVNVGAPQSSLYVGDLHPDVTEAMLFDKFSSMGNVLSIRVCRDAVTRASLGYAYVNYQQHADAERAMKNMSFDPLMGKPIRIMWSQRDPSMRRAGAGNIFIKNLSKHIDTKSMYDTFSMFGNILSCKVASDLDGKSKGYGFIHFETEQAATDAIKKVSGMLLEGKEVYVSKFVPRATRLLAGDSGVHFNNLYVKNFADYLDKDGLEKLFEKFGKIISCVVMLDENNKSKGFGFVCFEKPEFAEKAAAEMNGYELPGIDENCPARKITVCRVLKKSERLAELKRKYEQLKMERLQKYQGVNLYVKNLDDTVTEDALRRNFEIFGNITSVKIMLDENKLSKGFGFICFEKPEDATKAVVEMNGKMFVSKPLYVALAQRKEERKAQLAHQYMQRLAAMRMQNPSAMAGAVYTPAAGGYFVPSAMQTQRAGGYHMPGQTIYSGTQIRNTTMRYPNASNIYGSMQSGFPISQHRMNRSVLVPGVRQYRGQMQYGQRGIQGRSNLEKQNPPYVNIRSEETMVQNLANASPEEQKKMLHGKLIETIGQLYHEISPEDAGKVVDMLLEMDTSELIVLLQSNELELLRNKVNEALALIHGPSA